MPWEILTQATKLTSHALPSPNPSASVDGKASPSLLWKMLSCCCQLLLCLVFIPSSL